MPTMGLMCPSLTWSDYTRKYPVQNGRHIDELIGPLFLWQLREIKNGVRYLVRNLLQVRHQGVCDLVNIRIRCHYFYEHRCWVLFRWVPIGFWWQICMLLSEKLGPYYKTKGSVRMDWDLGSVNSWLH